MAKPATIGMLKKHGTETWLYETLVRLIEGQRGTTTALGAITRGEAPDGSGNSLVDTSLFFYKPGLPGGQTAYGGSGPLNNLVLSSTSGSPKGFIYFSDAAPRVTIDEANCRLGIGIDTPLAKLHISQTAGPTNQANSDVSVAQAVIVGAATCWQAVLVNDTSYIQLQDDTSRTIRLGLAAPLLNLAMTYTISFVARFTGTTPSAAPTFLMALYASDGTRVSGASVHCNTLTSSFATYTYTITFTGITSNSGISNQVEIGLSPNNAGESFFFEINELEIGNGGVNLTSWAPLNVVSSVVDAAGRFGIGITTGLTSMLTVVPSAAGVVAETIQGFASQTADLVDYLTSAGTVIGAVTKDAYLSTRQLLLNGSTSGTLTVLPAAVADSHSLILSLTGTSGTILTLAWAGTSNRTATIPDATDTFVMLAVTQTLSNKTLDDTNTATLKANHFTLEKPTDATSTLQFNLVNVNPGVSASITMPDYSGGVVPLPADQGITGQYLQSQGVGNAPNWQSFAGALAFINVAATWVALQKFKDDDFQLIADADATKIFQFDVDSATTSTTITLKSAQTASRTITLPDGTTTLAGLSIIQSFLVPQTFTDTVDRILISIQPFNDGGVGVTDIAQIFARDGTKVVAIGSDGTVSYNSSFNLYLGGIGGTTFLSFSYSPITGHNVVLFGDIRSGTVNESIGATKVSNTTVANTGTETTVGSAANTTHGTGIIASGRAYRIEAYGVISTKASTPGTLRVKIKKGSTVLLDTTAVTVPAGLAAREWRVVGYLTYHSTTTVQGQGMFEFATVAQGNLTAWEMNGGTTPVTVASTTETLAISVQWGTADPGNTLTCTNSYVTLLA